jgi:hypothetical protein
MFCCPVVVQPFNFRGSGILTNCISEDCKPTQDQRLVIRRDVLSIQVPTKMVTSTIGDVKG